MIWKVGVGLLLGLLVGWLLWGRPDPEPEAERLLQETRRDVAAVDTAAIRRAAADSAAEQARAAGRARIRQAEQVAAAAADSADRVRRRLDSLLAAAPAELRAAVAELDSLHQRTIAAKDVQIATLAADTTRWRRQWESADSLARATTARLHEALARQERTAQLTHRRPAWRAIGQRASCAGAGYGAAERSAVAVVVGGVLCAIL